MSDHFSKTIGLKSVRLCSKTSKYTIRAYLRLFVALGASFQIETSASTEAAANSATRHGVLVFLAYLFVFVVGLWILRRFKSRPAKSASAPNELSRASAEGNIEKVAFLLKSGENIDQSDDHGGTALMYAVRNNRQEVVELLIASGANFNAKTKQGTSCLELALKHGSPQLQEYLRDQLKTQSDLAANPRQTRDNSDSLKHAQEDLAEEESHLTTSSESSSSSNISEVYPPSNKIPSASEQVPTPRLSTSKRVFTYLRFVIYVALVACVLFPPFYFFDGRYKVACDGGWAFVPATISFSYGSIYLCSVDWETLAMRLLAVGVFAIIFNVAGRHVQRHESTAP